MAWLVTNPIIGNSIITSLYRTVLINGFLNRKNTNNLYLKY